MDPGVFGQQELDYLLMDEESGFWSGSLQRNSAFPWRGDQFSEKVFLATMRMASMIPAQQRGSAVRVSRWLVFLIGDLVLYGNWCTEEGCMDDGTNPGDWQGSQPIFAEWLDTKKH